jgi:hypothetical protein
MHKFAQKVRLAPSRKGKSFEVDATPLKAPLRPLTKVVFIVVFTTEFRDAVHGPRFYPLGGRGALWRAETPTGSGGSFAP